MDSCCVHRGNTCKTRSLLWGTYTFFVRESSNLSTNQLWVKITNRKENKSVVYTAEYSYGEINLINHHEISFIKYFNDYNKQKTRNNYIVFHLRHKIVINKQLNTSNIHSNNMTIYRCRLKRKTELIPPIYIAAISLNLDPAVGGTLIFVCN